MMTNREVFAVDPTEGDIPNLGVAKVGKPESVGDWNTLEWELRSFVCEGTYERGLERILDQFLSHLNQDEQPAVWVSGFFGSGKSHLMRVLEYLWRDYPFPSGVSARGLAELSPDIERHLVELSAEGKRQGGLWSAAGTLGSGAAGSIRLAFLGIIFDAAGLPQQYAPARLVVYLKNEGLYDQVQAEVEGHGRQLEHELRNLYVSSVLAEALMNAGARFGTTAAEVSAALQSQYPMLDDISNSEMLDTFEDVLRLESTVDGKLPLTLVVLDEMQQYINDENVKAEQVQHLVEGCSSRFGSQVVVVATGQAALAANPTLQKLIDRFSITVALSDTDVETVVRKVVLQKKPDAVAAVEEALESVSGEIDRQLGGTRLEAKAADKTTLVSDYPLLPTRRRFWELALRAIDKAGKAGVLRTQLKIVHEAAGSVADEPLGCVIGGDFIFHSESASMLQSGVLLKEIDELIRSLEDGSPEGQLKSRACALIFLISQLAHDGVGESGVRATSPTIADLLVEDLTADGAQLRREVPLVLEELVEQGRVMKLGDEFRLQTEEGAEWAKEFSVRRALIRDDAARMSQLRSEWLRKTIEDELAGLKLVHGESKTPRQFIRHWDDDEPTLDGAAVPLWIRNEWIVTESHAREGAATAGTDSPIVFVLLPRVNADAIRDALAGHAAAVDTLSQRPEPQTDEGREAKRGMQSRVEDQERHLTQLVGAVVDQARIFQGGGNELTTSSLRAGVEAAGQNALSRQFGKFGIADHANWGKVKDKARDGAPDALKQVDWDGDVSANPVCKEVLARTAGAGTKGSEIQRQLGDAPYGWPKDAIDGALLVLLANGNIRAQRDGQAVQGPMELPATQIGRTFFYKEDEPPSASERMAVRGVLTEANIPYTTGQEGAAISGLLQHLVDLAEHAGGPAPLPPQPDTTHIQHLQALAGNQQFRAVAKAATQLRQDLGKWTAAGEDRGQRDMAWSMLDRLLDHASSLSDVLEIRAQRNAVLEQRLLLESPDPVAPLIDSVSSLLRTAITEALERLRSAYESEVGMLHASEAWGQLSPGQQEAVLTGVGLVGPEEPDTSSNDKLIAVLNAQPLVGIGERIQALPAKGVAARRAMAEAIDPEPQVVTASLPAATLRSESDVDSFLAAFRAELMAHIEAGETVVT
ncbi:BREX system P-loop protein BrxC [Candidatus Poriferisodalis sp.]|uniref:BREX system P-loop protein BrxC n=1 Tax=Candidatus Poriferisodalis sp. TaxID=3101277 RepID=UPI003B02EAF2